jgi:tricarballylate dehydrogenase
VTCGITFTYGGLKIDTDARVLDVTGAPMPGLYAAGEIAGDFFHYNYAAGTGLMRGAVFGRIAGTNAAAHGAAVKG